MITKDMANVFLYNDFNKINVSKKMWGLGSTVSIGINGKPVVALPEQILEKLQTDLRKIYDQGNEAILVDSDITLLQSNINKLVAVAGRRWEGRNLDTVIKTIGVVIQFRERLEEFEKITIDYEAGREERIRQALLRKLERDGDTIKKELAFESFKADLQSDFQQGNWEYFKEDLESALGEEVFQEVFDEEELKSAFEEGLNAFRAGNLRAFEEGKIKEAMEKVKVHLKQHTDIVGGVECPLSEAVLLSESEMIDKKFLIKYLYNQTKNGKKFADVETPSKSVNGEFVFRQLVYHIDGDKSLLEPTATFEEKRRYLQALGAEG